MSLKKFRVKMMLKKRHKNDKERRKHINEKIRMDYSSGKEFIKAKLKRTGKYFNTRNQPYYSNRKNYDKYCKYQDKTSGKLAFRLKKYLEYDLEDYQTNQKK
jgi:hypothetical protein